MPNTTKHGGPPCPQLERLEELMELVTTYKRDPEEPDLDYTERSIRVARNEELQEVVEALDWLHTSLSNRKTYQKKQQIKKKVYLKLAREVLSKQELEQVEKDVEKQLAEVVANEA